VNKQAQVNEDELNGWSGYSEVLKQNMLRERQSFCKRVNARYGTNWSVDLQTPYKQETKQFNEASKEEPTEATEGAKGEATEGSEDDA
jgi:hypothetical protein